MRSLLVAGLVLPLLAFAAACGKGASDTRTPTAEDGGAGCGSAPSFTCGGQCNGEGATPPVCIDGTWTCDGAVSAGCPGPDPVPEDAGPCGPTTLVCSDCSGGDTSPVCESTGWTCPAFHCVDAGPCGEVPACPPSDDCTVWTPACTPDGWQCIPSDYDCDASTWDASDDASPEDAGTDDVYEPPFSCGNTACDPTTSFCVLLVGGPVEDGGSSSEYQCFALPQTCAGQPASCDCVAAGETSPGACGCIDSGDHVIVTCDLQ